MRTILRQTHKPIWILSRKYLLITLHRFFPDTIRLIFRQSLSST